MKYTRNWLIEKDAKKQPTDPLDYLLFYGHQASKDGAITTSCFSQWWSFHPFNSEGNTYLTAEHFMMAGKAKLFKDEEMLAAILGSSTPAEAKALGRKVKQFDQQKWEEKRCEIVVEGNYLKFSQHEDLKTFLLHTGSQIIVEASPRDRIWGIGMGRNNEFATQPANWRGRNLLGFCLMEVRDKLSS